MRIERRFFLAAVIAAGAALVAAGGRGYAADEPAAVGVWDCVSATGDGDEMPFTLTVKEEDGKLTATAGSDQGQIPLTDVEVNGDELSFKASLNDQDYAVKLKVTGDTLAGEWSGGGDSGTVKGKRHA